MENKKSTNILLIIMGVLILVELVFEIIIFQNSLVDYISLISLTFVALYGFWLYKKPHGNMLKYAILIAAVVNIFVTCTLIQEGLAMDRQIARIIASVILVYISGRLNRIDQNKFLFPIAFAIQFVCDIIDYITCSDMFDPIFKLTWFTAPIMILTLMIAYFVRYKAHKEAGLADAPAKQ